MDRTDYINIYSSSYENKTYDCQEDCLCANCLANWLDDKPMKRLDILNRFHLAPEQLANITNSIGGAEYYEFSHIRLLTALELLYPYMGMGDAHEFNMPYHKVKDILKDLFPTNYELIPPIRVNYGDELPIDIVLGLIINAEYFLFLHDSLNWPPSGDDTYFDYYPGSIFYFNAISEWFLNSENRIP